MLMIAGTIAFVAVFVLYASLAAVGYFQRLRPSSLFMLIMFVEFGPFFLVDARHSSSFDPGYTFGILDFGPKIATMVYESLAVAFLCLAAGYLSTHIALLRLPFRRHGELDDNRMGEENLKIISQCYVVLLVAAGLTCFLMLSIGAVRQQLVFFGHLLTGHVDPGDYEMMRRAVLPEDPFFASIEKLKLNYCLPIVALLTAWGVQLKRPLGERVFCIATFFVICLSDLRKQPNAVAILVIIISLYMANRNGVLPLLRRMVLPFLVVTVIGIVLLFGLYRIQYAGNPSVQTIDVFRIMYFRVFQANGIDLDLFFLFYKYPLFFKGQTTSSVLASLFGKHLFDANAYVPQSYGAMTTFPTLFFGAPWVDFGWAGIVFSSFGVGVVAALADFLGATLRFAATRIGYTACALFSLNYLAQLQFFTGLLTYGVMFQMAFFVSLDYLLWRLHLSEKLRFAV